MIFVWLKLSGMIVMSLFLYFMFKLNWVTDTTLCTVHLISGPNTTFAPYCIRSNSIPTDTFANMWVLLIPTLFWLSWSGNFVFKIIVHLLVEQWVLIIRSYPSIYVLIPRVYALPLGFFVSSLSLYRERLFIIFSLYKLWGMFS